MKKLGILGLGWFGSDLAKYLKAEYDVIGTKTKAEDAQALRSQGINAIHLDLNESLSEAQEAAICNVDILVLNIPPGIRNNDNRKPYSEMMKTVMTGVNYYDVKHLIFVSSTGVFGPDQLDVNEAVTPHPSSESGKILCAAENFFSNGFRGKTTILRPAGLVGKGRHPAKFLAGRKGISGPDHPVNLVHLDDLIRITEHIIRTETQIPILHAVTDHHPAKKHYYTEAAVKLNLEPPSFDDNDKSKGRRVDSLYTPDLGFPKYSYENLFEMI